MVEEPLSVEAAVAVSSPVLPHPDFFVRELSKRCAHCKIGGEIEESNNTFVFDFAGNKAVITLVSKPLPWEEIEEQCCVAWWWPEAAEKMQTHTAHVLVAIMGDKLSPVERYAHLTHLTAVVAEASDSIGVLFGSGSVVHPAKAFIARSELISETNVDPLLWIDMRIEHNDDGTLRFYSLGMTFVGFHEIEIDSVAMKPEDLLDFAYSTIAYILSSGEVIQHGDTIGRSEGETIEAFYAPSMYNTERTVLKLQFS